MLGVFCLLLMLLPASLMGTIAYLQAHSQVENTFGIAEAGIEIMETFDHEKKEKVTVSNTGDAAMYLRAALVVSWRDAEGRLLPDTPQETSDYTMVMGAGSDWRKGADGYWYCLRPVPAGGESPVLIESCTAAAEDTAERYLCVDILLQSVQADPADAVQELWGVDVAEDGTLISPEEVSAP